MNKELRCIWIGFLAMSGLVQAEPEAWPVPPQRGDVLPAPSFRPEKATLEELFFYASVYDTTPQKRADKVAAREAFRARKGESLRWLMEHIHLENLWIRILAFESARELDAETAVPILLDVLDDEMQETQRYAIFLLGFHPAPGSPPDLRVYLADENLRGSAIRTLGKWKQVGALPELFPYLKDEKERIRIMAVNALRDIGDPAAVEELESALHDRVFTVRKAAERAIRTLMAVEGGPGYSGSARKI